MVICVMEQNSITRRHALSVLGGVGIAGIAGCTSNRDASGGSETVKIGVLQPTSGDLKYYGQQSLWGFYEGFNHKSDSDSVAEMSGGKTVPATATTGKKTVTVGDRDYELLVRDTKLDEKRAKSLATDLIQEENIDLLFGCTSSSSATRVTTVAKKTGIPTLLGPAASAGITSNSETCGQSVFRASENTAMDARSGGRYVAQNTDISTVYLFGADYAFGHAVVENYKTVLQAQGVEIVGEKFVPEGYSEWGGLLDNAEKAGAEGIVAGFTVATLPQLFTTYLNGNYNYHVIGGFATEITVGIIGEVLKKVLGTPLTKKMLQNMNLGPFTTRYHWNQYDNEINSAFVDRYTKAYDTVPDLFTSGTFAASSAIVQAIEENGSTSSDDIISALRGMTIAETPKGTDAYTFQTYNNQARSEMTVANVVLNDVKNWDAAIKPSEPIASIPADQTTIPKGSPKMGCHL
jgi:branched-chain amino acid transport system substrate-binding protein